MAGGHKKKDWTLDETKLHDLSETTDSLTHEPKVQ